MIHSLSFYWLNCQSRNWINSRFMNKLVASIWIFLKAVVLGAINSFTRMSRAVSSTFWKFLNKHECYES